MLFVNHDVGNVAEFVVVELIRRKLKEDMGCRVYYANIKHFIR